MDRDEIPTNDIDPEEWAAAVKEVKQLAKEVLGRARREAVDVVLDGKAPPPPPPDEWSEEWQRIQDIAQCHGFWDIESQQQLTLVFAYSLSLLWVSDIQATVIDAIEYGPFPPEQPDDD